MSYTGMDLSNSPSDFVKPTYQQLEATAATKNMQVNLGIMPDTLAVPLSELGKEDTWKYKSSSARPTLAPLHNLRTANPETEAKESNAWQSRYEQIFNELLPEEIRTAIIANRAMAREEQITSLVALEYSLTAVAKAIVFIEAATGVLFTDAAKMRQKINEQIDEYVQHNYEKSADEVLSAAKEKMENLGRNDPNYDSLSYYSSLSKEGLSALSNKEGA